MDRRSRAAAVREVPRRIGMIVTLTPNPSFDLTMSLIELRTGELNRAHASVTEAGGKGLNVSRALAQAGIQSKCVFPANPADAVQLTALLCGVDEDDLLETIAVGIQGGVRTNVTITADDGQTTKVNAPGPSLTSTESEALLKAAVISATPKESSWLVGCGSLPRGIGADFYGNIRSAVGPSISVAVDTSGDALTIAARSGCDLIKPNQSELVALTGRQVQTLGDVVEACRAIVQGGVGQVLASLGSSGAILVSSEHEIHAVGPECEVLNTVGAGDATLAGFLSKGGRGPEALRAGVAWGSAAVQSPTTSFQPPDKTGIEAIRLLEPVWDTVLDEHEGN